MLKILSVIVIKNYLHIYILVILICIINHFYILGGKLNLDKD